LRARLVECCKVDQDEKPKKRENKPSYHL